MMVESYKAAWGNPTDLIDWQLWGKLGTVGLGM